MTIFAVLLPDTGDAARLEEAIGSAFPGEYLQVGAKHFLVSANGTAVEVSNKIGITKPGDPSTTVGSAIVFATSSYFGRAPTPVWDWIKAKLEKNVG
jgi:hypothetical protein